jgi:hypothetical protein
MMAEKTNEGVVWVAARSYVLPAVFFGSLFFHLLLYIDPHAVFVYNGIGKYSYILEFTKSYLAGVLSVPGGLTKLAVTFLVYACHYPAMGCLLMTLLAWALYAGGRMYCTKCNSPPPLIALYAPALLLMVIAARYNFQYLVFIVAASGTLLLSVLYQRVQWTNTCYRCIVFVSLSALSFYFFSLAGVVFMVLAGVYELLTRNKTIVVFGIAAACLIAALLVVKNAVFPFDLVFRNSDLFDSKKPVLYLFLFFPVLAIASNAAVLRIKIPDYASRPLPLFLFILRRVEELAILAVLVLAALWSMHDKACVNLRELGQTIYYEQNGMWRQILEKRTSTLFKNFPAESPRSLMILSHELYRSLYHTGQLGSRMFSFPQVSDPEPLLLSQSIMNIYFPAWAAGIDMLMDLAAVNFAEKVAGEAMENMGPHPFLLYRRGILQLAKGNDELASVYLNKLKNMPWYGKKAVRLLDELNHDPRLSSRKDIDYLRAFMDKYDYTISRASKVDEETVLVNLLKSNGLNNIAFEYLMAYYLLTRQPAKIAQNIGRMDNFRYTAIPVHWEEALLVYLNSDTGASVKTKLPVRQQTRDRFQQFVKLYGLYSQGSSTARETLYREFGTSYFFFHMFGYVPGAIK